MQMPPYFWLGLIAIAAILVGGWWARTQYLSAQRRSMRAFYLLSEEIFSATSPADIAEKLSAMLPAITQATHVRLYLLNHRTKSLESVVTSSHPEPTAASIDGDHEGLAAGVVKCFRNRAVVNVPDVRRNPLVNAGWKAGSPRSVMFVPLLAQQDTMGVIEAGSVRRLGYFTADEQATVQHLAKQVAASLKLQEQKEVREQLFRSEKLAATGQLISGVASDLRAPLDRILELSSTLEGSLDHSAAATAIERDLKQMAAEAQRVSEIVARLVSFARPAEAAARLVDVNALAAGLLQFREPEWKALGVRVQNRIAPESAMVLGVQGQIEEVYLNLLVYAEQCATRTDRKTLEITSGRMTGRVVTEIHFPSNSNAQGVSDANLDVCRAIMQNHGGDLRTRQGPDGMSFEVTFPLAPTAETHVKTAGLRKPGRSHTFLLVDSDVGAQRQLLGLLAARGHRVVPVRAEEAVDLAHRLRFDGVVWAVRPGGAKWSDVHERLRQAVPSFVLVSDGYDGELAASLAESGGFLLGRPIQEADLERVLQAIEARAAART
jgi:signal transduction histidine kinase